MKATYLLRVSAAMSLVGNIDIEKTLKENTDFLMSVLPKGTKLVSTESMAITDLSIPFLLTLEHPVFEEGMKIELDFFRECYPQEPTPEDPYTVAQINLFTGVRYLKADGTEKYKRYERP